MIIRLAKVTRVAKSGAVSFGKDGASRGTGRPSEDTLPANLPDRQMLPTLDMDSTTTTTQGKNTMMEHQEDKDAMRNMVSEHPSLSDSSADDVKKAYYTKFK